MENKEIKEEEKEKIDENIEKKKIDSKNKENLENKESHNNDTKKEEKKIKEVIVRGRDLSISTKHSVALCKFIKGKEIKKALKDLELVLKFKKAVPMKGEIPHRKNMKSGRYPIKATKTFIKLLKNLNANAVYHNIEEPFIFFAKADKASRPYRRFGTRRFKRTHILIKAKGKLELE
ncbi:MAG: uL22 family ribosomal protein [Candidatus Pacearchaeota archaeon]